MTPFEIATAIRNRDNHEDIQSFVLRTMPREKVKDFTSALNLLMAWERAFEEIGALCGVLSRVGAKAPDVKIAALIAAKRKLGYDSKLEALLARRWRCPHCKQFASIDKIELPIGDPDRLPRCGEEGIAPVETEARLNVREGGKSGLRP